MGKRATFTKAELTRAISAARDAGTAVNRCEIAPNGSIILSASEIDGDPIATAYDNWKASQR